MIPVRLKQYFDFGSEDGIVWRDIEMPTILLGMKFDHIFGGVNNSSEVKSWEYDAKDGRYVAWLADNPLIEEHFTFQRLLENGYFDGWNTSDFLKPAEV